MKVLFFLHACLLARSSCLQTPQFEYLGVTSPFHSVVEIMVKLELSSYSAWLEKEAADVTRELQEANETGEAGHYTQLGKGKMLIELQREIGNFKTATSILRSTSKKSSLRAKKWILIVVGTGMALLSAVGAVLGVVNNFRASATDRVVESNVMHMGQHEGMILNMTHSIDNILTNMEKYDRELFKIGELRYMVSKCRDLNHKLHTIATSAAEGKGCSYLIDEDVAVTIEKLKLKAAAKGHYLASEDISDWLSLPATVEEDAESSENFTITLCLPTYSPVHEASVYRYHADVPVSSENGIEGIAEPHLNDHMIMADFRNLRFKLLPPRKAAECSVVGSFFSCPGTGAWERVSPESAHAKKKDSGLCLFSLLMQNWELSKTSCQISTGPSVPRMFELHGGNFGVQTSAESSVNVTCNGKTETLEAAKGSLIRPEPDCVVETTTHALFSSGSNMTVVVNSNPWDEEIARRTEGEGSASLSAMKKWNEEMREKKKKYPLAEHVQTLENNKNSDLNAEWFEKVWQWVGSSLGAATGAGLLGLAVVPRLLSKFGLGGGSGSVDVEVSPEQDARNYNSTVVNQVNVDAEAVAALLGAARRDGGAPGQSLLACLQNATAIAQREALELGSASSSSSTGNSYAELDKLDYRENP